VAPSFDKRRGSTEKLERDRGDRDHGGRDDRDRGNRDRDDRGDRSRGDRGDRDRSMMENDVVMRERGRDRDRSGDGDYVVRSSRR